MSNWRNYVRYSNAITAHPCWDLYLDKNADDDLGDEKVPLLRFSVVFALAPALTFALGDFFDLVCSSFFFSLLREDSVVGIWKDDPKYILYLSIQ